jgi:hypothetical protein
MLLSIRAHSSVKKKGYAASQNGRDNKRGE